MEVLTPALFMFAALLVVAGIPKLVRPESTAKALAGVGLPGRTSLVRALGAAEIAIGATAIGLGGPLPALAVGLTYLGFAVFVAYAIGRGGTACGCLGSSDTPPSALHLTLNVAAASVGLLAATATPLNLITLLERQPLAGLPMLGFVGMATWFLYLVLAELPRLSSRGST